MGQFMQSPCQGTEIWTKLEEVLEAPKSNIGAEDMIDVVASMLAILASRTYCGEEEVWSSWRE